MASLPFLWRLRALYDMEGPESSLALVPACLSSFSDTDASAILGGFFNSLVSAGDYKAAEQLLAGINESAVARPGLRPMVHE